ncbi:hypothetical protein KQ945_14805 [Bacillus subtilis subsp. subtilis]|nr:hypothetical protein [Bacillus subtilis subsp. subtilis]
MSSSYASPLGQAAVGGRGISRVDYPVEYPGVVSTHEHSLRVGLITCPEPPGEATVVWRTEDMPCLDGAQRNVRAGCSALNVSELGPVAGYRFIDEAETVRSADGFFTSSAASPLPNATINSNPGPRHLIHFIAVTSLVGESSRNTHVRRTVREIGALHSNSPRIEA